MTLQSECGFTRIVHQVSSRISTAKSTELFILLFNWSLVMRKVGILILDVHSGSPGLSLECCIVVGRIQR